MEIDSLAAEGNPEKLEQVDFYRQALSLLG
jgi:hypothetical protein